MLRPPALLLRCDSSNKIININKNNDNNNSNNNNNNNNNNSNNVNNHQVWPPPLGTQTAVPRI